MSIHQKVRKVFEDFWGTQASPEGKMQVTPRAVGVIREKLGIEQDQETGAMRLNSASVEIPADKLSFESLGYHLIGPDWKAEVMRYANGQRPVFEAGTSGIGAITPGNLPNVSAYLGSVIGLLEHQILKGYEMPDLIIDKLIPSRPSKTRVTKLLGTSWMGDKSGRRNPGDPFPVAQFGDRVVTTQETQQDALKGLVTFESVFFDQTGQVLEQMNKIGQWLAMRKERDGFRLIAGLTNPYTYNGTNYSTYGTSGYWVNDVEGNLLRDWTAIDVVESMFSEMKDQETSTPILAKFDTILCSRRRWRTATYIQASTKVTSITQSGTVRSEAPKLGDEYQILWSPLFDQILTNSTTDPDNPGCGYTAALAKEYWFAVKTSKGDSAFFREENWPIRIQRASPTDYQMLDNGVVLAVFADQMHSFNVGEPRYVIRNKKTA